MCKHRSLLAYWSFGMCKQYVSDVHTSMRIPFTQVLYIIINNDEHSSMMIVINAVNEEIHVLYVVMKYGYVHCWKLQKTLQVDTSSSVTHGLLFSWCLLLVKGWQNCLAYKRNYGIHGYLTWTITDPGQSITLLA